eukprot:CFRG1849T1
MSFIASPSNRSINEKGPIADVNNAHELSETPEDNVLTLSVWLTQHTYYFGEPIKGLITATVQVPGLAVVSIKSVLRCVIKRASFQYGVLSSTLYSDTHDFLTGVGLLTVDTGEQEFRFRYDPDMFAPSFFSSIGSIRWSLAAVATMSDGAVYRSPAKQGNFRMGCVYHPTTSIHPRVFTESKRWFSSLHSQVSLSKLVHDVGEPVIVKFSSAANRKDININGIHIIQDVLLGDKKFSVAVQSLIEPGVANNIDSQTQVETNMPSQVITAEYSMAMDDPTAACAVVYELTLRGKRMSFPAPSMMLTFPEENEQVKIGYRVLVDFSMGSIMRTQKMMTLPFVVSDLCPPEDSLTNIKILVPPLEDLPDYDKLSTKSKEGRPEAVAPHIAALSAANLKERKLSVANSRDINRESIVSLASAESSAGTSQNSRKGIFRQISRKKIISIKQHFPQSFQNILNRQSTSFSKRTPSEVNSNGGAQLAITSDAFSTSLVRRQTVTLAELDRERRDREDRGEDSDMMLVRGRRTSRSQSIRQLWQPERQDERDSNGGLSPQYTRNREPVSTSILYSDAEQNGRFLRSDSCEEINISLPTYEEVVVSRASNNLSAQKNWW